MDNQPSFPDVSAKLEAKKAAREQYYQQAYEAMTHRVEADMETYQRAREVLRELIDREPEVDTTQTAIECAAQISAALERLRVKLAEIEMVRKRKVVE